MPTIRKVTRGSEFLHGHGTVAGGETVDVDADTAAYLVETGDYERVESDENAAESDPDTDTTDDTADTDADVEAEQGGYLRDAPPETQIDAGVCPWCDPDDRYEGDHIGQHASSAHPDEWDAYQAGGD